MDRTETARQTLTLHTVAHLRDLAREAGIAGRSRMRKADLVAALIPSTVAEMDLAEANRAEAVSRETVPTDFFAHTSAVAMHEAQLAWEEAEGEVAQGAAWEDYIDACYEAGLCTHVGCEAEAADTDDEHRCPTHLHGAALGDDVSRETTDPAESPVALAAEARLAQHDLNAARRPGAATAREISMAAAERDSALESCEDAYRQSRLGVSRETEREDLIERGLALRGWAAASAHALRDAIAEGRASELDSLTARLRRDV